MAVGAALAAAYVAVVAVTMVATDHPVRPLFDGLTPPPPYRWVNPPPGYGTNVKATPDEVSVALAGGGSGPAGPTGVNGQVTLNLPQGAIPARPGDTAVKIAIVPLDAAWLGSLPPRLLPDGNAYDIRMSYRPSGAAVTSLAVPGNIVLATPEPASVLVFSADGRHWETMETVRVGGPDSVGATFRRAGHYLAAIPGVARPTGRSREWLVTGRKVLIGALSVALVANLALRRRQSVHTRRRM
jgi:hypothetical protein